MRRHLKEYVRRELFRGKEMPLSTNRRLYPTTKDIRNHIYRATVKQRFAKCDQSNVSQMVNKWCREHPDNSFYFRPYANINEPKAPPKLGVESGDDDIDEVKVTTPLSQQKLLFVHQTQWQKRLLVRYGNDICLLDATHKTTRYSLLCFSSP